MPNAILEGLYVPNAMSLESLLSGSYEIPIYQRPYSWGANEISDLLLDI